MAVIISPFVDYHKASIDEQKELISELEIKSVALRSFLGESVLSLTDEKIKELASFLNKAKVKVSIIDPLIEPYSIYQDSQVSEHSIKWQQSLKIAAQLKAKAIYYRLPLFNDIIAENKVVLELIKRDLSYAKAQKIDVVFKFDSKYKVNTYHYIISHLNESSVSVLYEPLYIYQNKESLTTTFRFLKNSFNYVNCDDVDANNIPRLIGFGKLEWMDFFKKLFKLKYNGHIILDLKILDILEANKKKTPLFAKFKKSFKHKNKVYEDLVFRVGGDDVKSVLKHQLQILNLVFYNK